MLLAVDIGNSETSFGLFNGDVLRYHWRFETRHARSQDEYASLFFPLLTHLDVAPEAIKGIALCSVVPPADRIFRSFCRQYLKKEALSIGCDIDLGFAVHVDSPQEVGADRLANVAYAVTNLSLPAVVLDAGTALTLDVVSATPAFEGGVILPGVHLAARSLSVGTAKLPSIDVNLPRSVIGKNTAECIQSGLLFGYADMIDGLFERTQRALGKPTTVVLTGGQGVLFQDVLRCQPRYVPELTLEGIRILYEREG